MCRCLTRPLAMFSGRGVMSETTPTGRSLKQLFSCTWLSRLIWPKWLGWAEPKICGLALIEVRVLALTRSRSGFPMLRVA